jgi:signal transduction histidine kinase
MEDKNIRVQNEVPENLVRKTDENFVTVIIRNLLQNAVKYSEENSTISISADSQHIKITNQSSQTNAATLNALLLNKQVDSKVSGLGLQISQDLASSIQAKILFSRPSDHRLAAVLSWEI